MRPIGNPVVMGSLFRSVSHALLSTGRYKDAVRLTSDAASYLDQYLSDATAELLSVYGTLLLGGSVAAARASDAGTARTFLTAADEAATRLGEDANHLWTAFGPTNVAIHRVAAAGELGDFQVAIDLGSSLDTASLPMERRVRHALEVSRAYSSWNRQDDALAVLLVAERMAPEQVRHHYLGRQLVLTWIRQQRGKPSSTLVGLAHRLHVLDLIHRIYPARVTTSETPPMATPRVAAGALFFDESGRVLLVKPSYKDGWEIPGGYVEPGESPRAACIREVQEELGVSPAIDGHLVVDWAPAQNEGDKVLFVFDAGILTEVARAEIKFRDGELIESRFVADADMDGYLPARLSRRIRTAIRARHRGVPVYAEHGDEPQTQ